jgi:uncharacterized phiE125 gp8 family phage protein
MQLKIVTPPSIEPVSLQEIKEHLNQNSGSAYCNLDPDQLIPPGSHAVASVYTCLETMTLDVAPGGAGWAAGDTITGATSTKTCKIVEKLTALTYTVWNRSGAFTLGEILSNGTATADQGAAYPTFTRPYADVLGYQAVVILDAGMIGSGGTLDGKIVESDDHATWTDWAGGALTQVTGATTVKVQKIAYTGNKQYISVLTKPLVAASEFGVSVIRYASDATEDNLLTALITAAREQAEAITHRQLITATWDASLDEFPCKPFINLPFGNLSSVTSITYKDSAGTTTTLTENTDYLVETNGEGVGRIVLPYGGSWPSATLWPSNPITVRFVCGYGATAASVKRGVVTAIKMMVENLYNNRSEVNTQAAGNVTENKAVAAMLWPFRIWEF